MDGILFPEHPAEQLNRSVRDDLVHIHVRLGARSGLPDVQRKILVERARDHLVGCLDDRIGAPLI
jgi:hypothetical protein